MYTPVFNEVPDGWQERWGLIRTFVSRLYDVEMPSVGRVPKQARQLIAKLRCKRLPPSIVEWIAFTEDLQESEVTATDMWALSLQVTDWPDQQSISLNMFHQCMNWAVRYDDFDKVDPPVRTYAYVEAQHGFVHRKSYGTAPVTVFALDTLLNHGWSSYSATGSELKDPKKFLSKLPNRIPVSDPFGSIRFIEGRGWLAFVHNGYGVFGNSKHLTLRFRERIPRKQIPKQIREKVGMKLIK